MIKQIFLPVILCFGLLAGCGSQKDKTEIQPAAVPAAVESREINLATEEITEAAEETIGNVPLLASDFTSLKEAIPSGWRLLDSAETDYNADGHSDIIAVLTAEDNESAGPRILFAAMGDGNGSFTLDFQDINLIRASNEGGVYGDPYQPMQAEGNSFTISAYGGSSWRWSESTTFEYKNNGWYLAEEERESGYGPAITRAESYDYRTGVGVIRCNNSDSDNIPLIGTDEHPQFELEFEVRLDEAPGLYETGERWWLAEERITELPVTSVSINKTIDLKEEDVPNPLADAAVIQYMDEEYLLYTFSGENSNFLALYSRSHKEANVIAEESAEKSLYSYIDASVYGDKIYFGQEAETFVKNDEVEGQDEVYHEKYVQMVRLNLDGSGKEIIFRYDLDDVKGKAKTETLPYLSLSGRLSGNELIVYLYRGEAGPDRYYRMNLDGSGLKLIGELRGFYNSESSYSIAD